MKLLSLFILWFLGFVIIALSCIKFNASAIEHELIKNTRQILMKNGFRLVTPTINGQLITLKGIAVSHENRLQAESITRAIDGVMDVNNQLTVTRFKSTAHQTDLAVDNVVHSTDTERMTKDNDRLNATFPPVQESITNKPIVKIYTVHGNNTLADVLASLPDYNVPNVNTNPPWGHYFPTPPWENQGYAPDLYAPIPYGHMPSLPYTLEPPIAPEAPVAPFSPF